MTTRGKVFREAARGRESYFFKLELNGCRVWAGLCEWAETFASVVGTRVRRGRSQQKRLDAVRVHHLLAGRPGEDREATILRGDERHGVALILYELRRGHVSRAAELHGLDDRRGVADDRLGQDQLLDRRAASPSHDLRAEGEQLVVVADDGRAVHGGQPAD